jgi:predicted permease
MLSSSTRRTRVRQALVVVQVALSLILLVSAGLFIRTLQNAQTLDTGFSTRNGLFSSIDLLPGGYDAARGTAFFRTLLARVREIPGVQGATVAQQLPLNLGGGSDFTVSIDGYTPTPNEDLSTYYNRVGSGYLATMGVRLIEGRDFTDLDLAGRPDIGIINQTMARRYWNGRSAIGGRIRTGGRAIEVVGVVVDGKYSSITEPPRNYLYVPVQQWYRPDGALIVKTAGDPVATLSAVQRVMRELDPNLPLFDTRTIEEHLELSLFIQRMAATLLGAFGVLALLLATVGLYAVIATGVAQRTPEIGMRMALGAARRDIIGLVLRQGLGVTAIGLVVGIAGSLAVTRLFKGLLVGVNPTDGISFVATSALLVMVAIAATYLPARRAASIDPLSALRQD